MNNEVAPYWFLLLVLGLSAFFLVRFWYTVDEIRKDVKTMVSTMLENKAEINGLKEKVKDLKEDQRDQEQELGELHKDVNKLKQ